MLSAMSLDFLDHIDPVKEAVCRQKRFYAKRDPLEELSDQQFREKYRMKKESFWKLHDLLANDLDKGASDSRGHEATASHTQLLITLRFYSAGTFQDLTGETFGVSQSQVCKIIKRVSAVIAALAPQYIKLPTAEEAKQVSICRQTSVITFHDQMHREMYKIAAFPNVWALIDGTHVPVIVPKAGKDRYWDRKGNTSLNIQVCRHIMNKQA